MAARGLTTLEYASGLHRDVTRLEAALADAEARERRLLHDRDAAERAQLIRLRGVCVYCGRGPTQGTPGVCWAHVDLPLIDPHYGATL